MRNKPMPKSLNIVALLAATLLAAHGRCMQGRQQPDDVLSVSAIVIDQNACTNPPNFVYRLCQAQTYCDKQVRWQSDPSKAFSTCVDTSNQYEQGECRSGHICP